MSRGGRHQGAAEQTWRCLQSLNVHCPCPMRCRISGKAQARSEGLKSSRAGWLKPEGHGAMESGIRECAGARKHVIKAWRNEVMGLLWNAFLPPREEERQHAYILNLIHQNKPQM